VSYDLGYPKSSKMRSLYWKPWWLVDPSGTEMLERHLAQGCLILPDFFWGGILLNHIEPWIIGDYTALFGIYAIYLDWYYLIHIYWLRDSGSPLDVWCWWDLGPNAWHVFTPLFFLARCASDFRCVSFGKSSCWEIYGRNSPIPFTWKTTQFRGFQNM
jgi:hypothetical protein